MNNKDEMLKEFDIDLETADRIAKEYPSLSDSARERMFNKTMKKLNITDNSDKDSNSSVYEVEKYNRPVWRKFAGIAATIAIIAGSIGGGVYMLHNMNDTAPPIDLSSGTEPDTDIVTIVESSVVTNVSATDAVVTAASSAVTASVSAKVSGVAAS